MASVRSRKAVVTCVVGSLLVAVVCLWWLDSYLGSAGGSPPLLSAGLPGSARSAPSRSGAHRASGADAALAANSLSQGDPAWDSDILALWRTLQDTTQDTVVRESAALKLASHGDRRILERLWALWLQGRLPAGCSWIRDLMAAASQAADAPPGTTVVTGEERPEVSAADVTQAVARAANTSLQE